MIVRTRAVGIALGAVLLAGCSLFEHPPIASPPPEQNVLDRDAYVIGPEDKLKITVWKNPELSVEVPVRPDGKISVPLLNDVQAAGLTAEELKELLTKQLAEFVSDPNVTVIVTDVLSKRIYVVGGVVRAGAQPLNQDMRVLDALSVAGGFKEFADKDHVKILRRKGGGLVEYRFDYGAYLKGRAPESNMLLAPGDTIVVPD